MYFFQKSGKQHLDLRGDLILTHNDALVKARVKSSAPRFVSNATYIMGIPKMGFWSKLKATRAAIAFIWGADKSLTSETIDKEGL